MKYPSTLHLPWSPGIGRDDKIVKSIDHLLGKNIVITEKLDGENTSFFIDKIHARSADSGHHESRSWVKNYWSELCHRIPEDVQIYGENLYAKHSIHYIDLDTYFYGFMALKKNTVLSWPDTLSLFSSIGIKPVPTLSFGPLSKEYIQKRLIKPLFPATLGSETEGYVLRIVDEFSIKDFDKNIFKYVRKDHVQTDKHWTKTWVKNDLKK